MASNDDFFGGFFDLDGDGKTDLGEQFLANKFFEELEKEENEDDDDWHTLRMSTAEQRRPSKPLPSEQPIPEQLTLSEYKRWKSTIINGCIVSLILCALFCILPSILIWAAITSYDPRNSASFLVVSVFCLVGVESLCVF